MSYTSVFYNKKTNNIHYWEYENDQKVHKTAPAPLYFFIESKEPTEYKTIFGSYAKKIECDTYANFLEKIQLYKDMKIRLFESDIPIETKFIVNNYLTENIVTPKLDIHMIDIEVHSEEGFPHPEEAKYPIVIITVWSTKEQKFYIFAERDFDDSFIQENHEKFIYRTEEMMLQALVKFFYTKHPDIISGWFIDDFDIPYIINRITNILGEKWAKRISPIGIINQVEKTNKQGKEESVYQIAGIECIDMLKVYKRYTFEGRENYKLGYITKVELGENITKKEYEGSLSEFYNNDWQGYVEYNIQDTRLLNLLENKLGYIKLLIAFCYGCRVPFNFYEKTTKVLDGAFISELAKEHVVLPDVNRDIEKCKFVGGYVKEPIPGVYDWVVSFDATSLYPSILMGWNISPETKVAVLNRKIIKAADNAFRNKEYDDLDIEFNGKTIKIAEFVKNDIDEVNKIHDGIHYIVNKKYLDQIMNCLEEKEYNNLSLEWNEEKVDIQEVCKRMKDNGYCITGCGVIYRQDIQGVVPRFVNKWFNERNRYKKMMKQAKKDGDSDKEKLYDLLQLNYKILINSVYGFLSSIYSRFFDYDNAVSVTSTGRCIIRTTGNSLNNLFENWGETNIAKQYKASGFDGFVRYFDTDSLYLYFDPILKSIKFPLHKYDEDTIKNFIIYNKAVSNNQITEYITKENITRDELEEKSKSLQNYVSNYIKNTCNVLTTKRMNCKENKIYFKREKVSSRCIFFGPKMYVTWALNNEGIDYKTDEDKFQVTGIDIVRSSTPLIVQDALEKIFIKIIRTKDNDNVDKEVRECYRMFMKATPEQVATPKSVNNLVEYTEKYNNNGKSIPIQVRAAIVYNKMIESNHDWKNKYQMIYDGDKMKYFYLKTDNFWRENVIGFKDRFPSDFGINNLIDYDKQFDKCVMSPIERVYKIFKWNVPDVRAVDNKHLLEW